VREERAAKLGFSAYAVSSSDDDPVAQAIHGLTDHTGKIDERIQALADRLAELQERLEAAEVRERSAEGQRVLRKVVDN
jgi:serine O-acetyltransferase